jgi:hypothetical protein
MQRCGVDSIIINDIPFGVRALQRGIEVEGIWISNANTPQLSQVASSATLVGDKPTSFDSRTTPQVGVRTSNQEQLELPASTTAEEPKIELQPTKGPGFPAATRYHPIARPHPGARRLQSTTDATPRSSLNNFTPRTRGHPHQNRKRPPVPTGKVSLRTMYTPTHSPINRGKENLAREATRTREHRRREHRREGYLAKVDPNAQRETGRQAETIHEEKHGSQNDGDQNDSARRPPRQRVSRQTARPQLR